MTRGNRRSGQGRKPDPAGAGGRPASPPPLTATGFQAETGVSRETLDRLDVYAALLRKWQPAINLVGPRTLDDLWRRHMLDSAQLQPLLPPESRTLVDLGSGAGFPGLVLAILGVPDVHLIESDQRKATFLREVSRETAAPVTVHAARAEAVAPFPADVVTARALAPLPRLVDLATPFLTPATVCLFLKGQDVDAELTEATKEARMTVDSVPSRTDPRGRILILREIARV
jgi:16S rRNA (guanine527-N7)-methyltransferase